MVNIYFSTVGLFLDIIVLCSLVFANLGEYKFIQKCKMYVPVFILFKFIEPLKISNTILFYFAFYTILLATSKIIFKFKPWNLFIFITNFMLFVLLDSYVYFTFSGAMLIISSTVYKIALIYLNQKVKLPNLENKNVLVNKILTNISISILILLSLYIKEVI